MAEIKELKDTVDLMLSDDYKERFLAEIHQLKIRTEKLHRMVSNWDHLDFKPACPKAVYSQQLYHMSNYLRVLIDRGEKEGIFV